MAKKPKKLTNFQLKARQRMNGALFEIVKNANLFAAAERDFYRREIKQKRKRKTLLG